MVELTDFNPVGLLETDQDIVEFLNDAYQDDNDNVFIVALGEVVKHKGVTAIAKKAGLTPKSLYKVFNGQAKPRWDTVKRLLAALDLDLNINQAA